jgi:hypothetical protein
VVAKFKWISVVLWLSWKERQSSVFNHSLYNMHFTDVVQYADQTTDDGICGHSEILDMESQREAFRYTLIFDLDSNGHSGSFYRLLHSRSPPWNTVCSRDGVTKDCSPGSITYQHRSVWKICRCLANEGQGRQIAAILVENGRKWSSRASRPVDQVV